MQLLKHYGLLGKMPNEHIRVRISQSSNYNLAPAPKKDKRKHANIIKNASDGTMSFMVWSVAGTALVACSGSTLIANGTNDGSSGPAGGAGVCDAVICLKEEGPSVRLGPTDFGLPAPQGEDSLQGVYIETGVGEVGTEAIDVMFRNGGDLEDDAGDVPLETATVDGRGVPTIIPAGFQNSITVDGTNLYFVSAENLERLVLNPNNDYEGNVRDFKIRYYAYDSADETFADTTATLAGASALDVAFEADDDPVTAVAFVPGSLVSVAEDTTARTEVVRLMFTDPDGGSPGTLDLVGINHEMFQIEGNVLYLRANQSLDFETLPTLTVRVQLREDTSVGADFTIDVTNVDDGDASFGFTSNRDIDFPVDGDTLTVALDSSDPDGNGNGGFDYQWQRSDADGNNYANISGAINATYEIIEADEGNTLRVVVSYIDGGGFSETVTTSGISVLSRLSITNEISTLDLTVIEDDAADNTARGLIQVTQATSPIAFSGGTTTGTSQVFNGIYGQLIVDGDGNWTYVLDNLDTDTNGLTAVQEGREVFTVIISETGGAMRTISQQIIIIVTGVDDVATAIALTGQVINSLAEDSAVPARMKVADIDITDEDDGSPGTLERAGRDADEFEIDGGVLYLKRGASLDYEDADTLEVRVQLNEDPSVGADLTIDVTNVNEGDARFDVTSSGNINAADEGDVLTVALDSSNPDLDGNGVFGYRWQRSDADGNIYSDISGATRDSYTITGDDVGTILRVVISYTDGGGYDEEVIVPAVSFPVTGDNLATAIVLTGQVNSLAEDADVSARIKVADIAITDDDDGLSGTLDIIVTDARIDSVAAEDIVNMFEITGSGLNRGLYLKSEQSLDFETLDTFPIRVQLRENPSVGADLTINVTNVDEGDASFDVTSDDDIDFPVEGDELTVALDPSNPDPDGNGNGGFDYQWQRSDANGNNYANISGATRDSYTIDTADEGNSLRVLVSYTDGGGTDEEVTTSGVSVLPPLSITNEAVRAFVIVNGIEFRVNAERSQFATNNYEIDFQGSSIDNVDFTSAITVFVNTRAGAPANPFSQANINRIFNERGSAVLILDLVAIILEEDGSALTRMNWNEAGTNTYRLSPASTTLDLAVTEDDAADDTARGFIQVTQATSPITFSGGTTAGTYQIFNGTYGQLIVDGDGNWTYVLNNEDIDTNTLSAGQEVTETTFNVIIRETGGAMRTMTQPIIITVTGADDFATAIVLTGQVNSLAENANRMKVADIGITDNDGGLSGTLERAGRDADEFEIIGTELYLKQGASVDYEQAQTLEVRVQVREEPSVRADLTINVTNVDEGDASFDVTSDDDIDFPVAGDTLTVALDPSNPDPDGNGNGGFDYQWQRSDANGNNYANISGATRDSYTIDTADEGNSLRVLVSYTDGGGTDEEVTTSGVSVLPPLSITNEAVRAFVIVNGIEFRVNAERSQFATNNYEIDFQGSSSDNVEFTSAITVFVNTRAGAPANPFSQANINRIFNERGSAVLILDLVAIILEEDASALTRMNWNEAGTNTYRLSPASTTLDLAVTEDDAADDTARGFIQVTQATSPITFSGGTTAGTSQIFNGTYGQLIVDGDGNWTYVLNNEDIDTNTLSAGQEVTETTFNVIIRETGGAMRTMTQPIIITVTGADDFATAIVLTGQVNSLAENANRMKVADIGITDNDGGLSGTLERAGRDADEFEIIGTELYLKQGASVDYEQAQTLEVRVQVQEDPSVGADLTINVTNVDEGDASFDVTSNRNIDFPVDGDTLTATLDISDLDGNGNGGFDYQWQRDGVSITGATSASYTIDTADEGNSLRVLVSYTDGGGTDEEVTTSGVSVLPPLSITNEAVRAFVIVNGIEFRVNAERSQFATNNYEIDFQGSSSDNVEFTSAITVFVNTRAGAPANPFSQANINRIFNERGSAVLILDLVAIILEEDASALTGMNWNEAGTNTYRLSPASTTLDLAVTEDDAADDTARGFLQVTQATSPITFSGGTAGGTAAYPYQIFNGTYGQLIVDGGGNWTYVLDDEDIDTNGLSAGEEDTETFNVIINETGGAMRATPQTITITVTGADDVATAIALTGQVINSLAENANVSARMKVADIGITDGDGGSPGTLELAGTGADEFEIDGGVLYLKRGASLDYEDADTLEVRVQLNEDPSVSAGLTIAVTNVDEGEARFNVTSDGDINVPVAGDELTVTLDSSDLDGNGNGGFAYRWQRSDADGNIYSDISGATMDSYTITGGDMGTILRVVISYTDGGGYDEEVTISAAAVRVAGDDLATAIAFSNQVNSLAEDADVSARIKVADITITDDDDGLAGTLERAGRDADEFEIIGTELYLRQGARLDHEQADTLEVRVQLRENTSVGAGLTIDVTNADDGDASFDVTSDGDINFPVAGDELTVALDLSNPDPDGNGNGGFDYQWQRDDNGNGNFVPITGATNASYTIAADDDGNTLRVVVSYTDGSGTDEEVTTSGVSVLPPLSITNEAVRAFVIVNGIEFRINADRSPFLANNYEIDFQALSSDMVSFSSAISVFINTGIGAPANPFSQANINHIFNERQSSISNLDLVAIIFEEDTSALIETDWESDEANRRYDFSPANTTLDLAVTEDDAADNTARGFIQVTQATSSITFSGGTTAGTSQIFNGRYGQLIVDGDGNWTYVLDNEDIDTNELLARQEVTETFNVIISETGGAMRTTTQPIIITVTGASEFATAIAFSNQVINSLAEDANVSARMKVADIDITDGDGGSPGTLERAGRDADKFEIDGGVLYLKRGASLDYEDADTLDVRVQLREDTSVRADLTIDVTNVDEGEARFDVTSDGDINVPVAGDELTVALDPSNPDPDGNGVFAYRWQRSDADGNNYSDISGATRASYTITGGDVGTILRVVVSYTDGGGYDEEVIVPATAVRVTMDDLATAIAFTNQVITDLAEDANVSARMKVADIDITDEDGGLSGTLELDGTDADKFEIIGTVLYLRQGARLDYEQAQTLEVRVRLRENTSINDNLTINVTNADDGDASFDVTSDGDINIPVAGDVLTVAPDPSNPDPDGDGVFTYQWQRDDGDGNVVPIAGATSTSYTITEADKGNALTVAASYTDGGGFSETVTTSRVAVPLFVLPIGPEDGEPITTQIIAPSINFRATGTTNAELIRGTERLDFISTRGGDDVVIGGADGDRITLGTGDEEAGAETIIYRFASSVQTFVTSRITMTRILVNDLLDAVDGRDQISNFEYGVDKLIMVDIRSDNGDPINSLAEFLAMSDDQIQINLRITGTEVTGFFIASLHSPGSINITFAEDGNRPIFDPEDMTGRSIHEHVTERVRAPGLYDLNDDVLADAALVAEILLGGEEFFHVGTPDILPDDLDITTGLDFL